MNGASGTVQYSGHPLVASNLLSNSLAEDNYVPIIYRSGFSVRDNSEYYKTLPAKVLSRNESY